MADPASIPAPSANLLNAVVEFRRAWHAGEQPVIEEFLARGAGPDVLPQVLFEALFRVELEVLTAARSAPTEADYNRRFPEYRALIHEVIRERAPDAESESWTQTWHDRPPAGRELPQRIGRYEIQREIGRGSFGIVYLAHDPDLDCLVAIKKLSIEGVAAAAHDADVSSRDALDRLLQEARFAARLRQYPGIVPVLDVLTETDAGSVSEVCFVQQYIDGGDLRQVVREGPLPPVKAAGIVRQVAQAVGHAHALGIYHRDLKPGNIILDSHSRPFVADFGLAVDERLQKQHRGEVSGTLAYMSPEQTRGESHLLDGRSDIWALGVILYELLTGQMPFRGDSRTDLFEEICQRDPRPPRMLIPQLPPELERIALKCLSRPITGRYTTAFDLADELAAWITATETPANVATAAPVQSRTGDALQREAEPVPRRRWPRIAAAGLFTLLVPAAAYVAFLRPEPDRGYIRSVPYPLLSREPTPVVVPTATDQRMRPVDVSFDAVRQSFSIQSQDLCFYALGDAPQGRYLFETNLRKPVHEGVCGVFFGLTADNGVQSSDANQYWSCHAILLMSYHRGLGEPVSRLERHRIRFQQIDQHLHLVNDDVVCQTPVAPVADGAALMEIRVRDDRVELIRWNRDELRSLVIDVTDGSDESWSCRGQFGVACFRGAVEFAKATLLLE